MSHEKGIDAASHEYFDCCYGEHGEETYESFAARIVKAYLDASGMVMVPRDPTDSMCNETSEIVTHVYGGDYNGYMDEHTARAAYACMIAAAPNPFQTPEESREKK